MNTRTLRYRGKFHFFWVHCVGFKKKERKKWQTFKSLRVKKSLGNVIKMQYAYIKYPAATRRAACLKRHMISGSAATRAPLSTAGRRAARSRGSCHNGSAHMFAVKTLAKFTFKLCMCVCGGGEEVNYLLRVRRRKVTGGCSSRRELSGWWWRKTNLVWFFLFCFFSALFRKKLHWTKIPTALAALLYLNSKHLLTLYQK